MNFSLPIPFKKPMKTPLFFKSLAVLFLAGIATAAAQDVKVGVLKYPGRDALVTALRGAGLQVVDSAAVDTASGGKPKVDSAAAVEIGPKCGATVLVSVLPLPGNNVAQILSTSNATVVGATGKDAKGLASAIKQAIDMNKANLLK